MKPNDNEKKRIKELVDNMAMSKKECAKQIGKSYSTLNGLYNHGKNARIHTLIQIANLFNVSTDYILGLSDNKDRKNHRH